MLSPYKGIIYPKLFIGGDYDLHSHYPWGQRYSVSRVKPLIGTWEDNVRLWLVQRNSPVKMLHEGIVYRGTPVKKSAFKYFEKYGFSLEFMFFDHEIFIDIVRTKEGLTIGDTETALVHIQKYGITHFENAHTGDNICSIGFNEKTQTWYGWSHRAISGFKIGDTVEEGDCVAEYLKPGFRCDTLDDCKRCAVAFADSVS